MEQDQNKDQKQDSSSSSAPAAAAAFLEVDQTDQFRIGHDISAVMSAEAKREGMVLELSRLGLSLPLAKHFVERDQSLVQAAIPHFRQRFADRHKRPVTSRAGYMRVALANPEKYGFEIKNGAWHAPPADGDAGLRERSAKQREAMIARAVAEEEKSRADREHDRWLEGRWDALPEAEKEAIRAKVRENSLFFHGKTDAQFSFHSACLQELEARGQ
jgi:hypothetical protein